MDDERSVTSLGATASTDAAVLREIIEIGISLAAERRRDRLLERILLGAMKLAAADGGTIYLRTDDDHLAFTVIRNDSLDIHMGGTTGLPVTLPPIPLHLKDGSPNHNNVATYVATTGQTVTITDAYAVSGFDFSGTRAFDKRTGYRSTSFISVPLVDHRKNVIGVIQLLNSLAPNGIVVPFPVHTIPIVEALAGFAGVAIENQQLIDGQRRLFDTLIEMMAKAIDAKSPYTGGHCQRVPALTEMLAKAACDASTGPFAEYGLSEAEWYELQVAGGLHDIGKVVTPVHVMDKSTKLEGIYDRMGEVRLRFELAKQALTMSHLQGRADTKTLREQMAALDDDLLFLERTNIGGEYLSDEAIGRIRLIALREFTVAGRKQPILSDEEVANLTVRRGTLNAQERKIINDHIVHTLDMLEALPWPKHLRNVPHIAGTHHEKMDGTGYPRGLKRQEISPLGRMMAIADIYEALTAQDRPYKPPKPISESLRIMAAMSRDHHVDPELFELFVTSGVYRAYGERFLLPEQLDAVDEAAILAAAVPRDRGIR